MARIRTIKPEFPHSESMGRVSRDARLLFIQLWTICDDSGKARGNSRMLASLLFPYDDDAPALIGGWLEELEREDCVALYKIDGTTYLQIRNWLNHQKIDKPSPSKIPDFDESSRILANPREHSSEDQGPKDQGPEDQRTKGVDQGPSSPPATKSNPQQKTKIIPVAVATGPKDETELQAACKATWQAYSLAYANRYAVDPVRNAKTNSAIKGFVQRVGMDEAPLIAAFYVGHSDAFYVRKCHDPALLQSDAEKLRTEWATNRRVTSVTARQQERVGTMRDVVTEIIAERGGA